MSNTMSRESWDNLKFLMELLNPHRMTQKDAYYPLACHQMKSVTIKPNLLQGKHMKFSEHFYSLITLFTLEHF